MHMQENLNKKLMPKLEVKNLKSLTSQNYEVIINDTPYLLNVETVVKFRLVKGKEILSLEEILAYDTFIISYTKYKKHLYRYPKTEKAFRFYLKNKEPNLESIAIEAIITKLKLEKVLDDRKMAQGIYQRLVNKGYGEKYICAYLNDKGISYQDYQDLLTNEEDDETLLTIAKKQLRNYAKYDVKIRRQKLLVYLLNKGYSYSKINDVIKNLLNQEN